MKNLHENNGIEMNTQVQTYLVEETMELIYDGDRLAQWNNLVTELGLKGQSQIVKPDKSPIPFMHMKKSMENIFKELCPRTVNVEEFSITPIPVEILDLIALSKKEGYFSRIIIQYDDKQPDPVCIGVIEKWVLHEKGTYNEVNGLSFTNKTDAVNYCKDNAVNHDPYNRSWDDVKYLIGKWGDVKQSISELKELAKVRFIEREGVELRKTIKESQRKLDDLETTAIEQFN